MTTKKIIVLTLVAVTLLSCEATKKIVSSINVFPVSKDKEMGLKVSQELANDPKINIISEQSAPEAYKMLNDMVTSIKASGKLKYKDDFAWEVHIIKKDDELNAFCTPGGYIYFYTGLMKYLDTADQLAGVMGHEMAHADKRHSTTQLTKKVGVQTLLSLLLGDKSETTLAKVGQNLINLVYSRSDETEADTEGVSYLCNTTYKADGGAVFFEKLVSSGSGGGTPAFLSTHPSPDKRVENIREKAKNANCNEAEKANVDYKAIVNAL